MTIRSFMMRKKMFLRCISSLKVISPLLLAWLPMVSQTSSIRLAKDWSLKLVIHRPKNLITSVTTMLWTNANLSSFTWLTIRMSNASLLQRNNFTNKSFQSIQRLWVQSRWNLWISITSVSSNQLTRCVAKKFRIWIRNLFTEIFSLLMLKTRTNKWTSWVLELQTRALVVHNLTRVYYSPVSLRLVINLLQKRW